MKMRQLFDRELLVHNQSPRTQTADIDALNAHDRANANRACDARSGKELSGSERGKRPR